MGGRTGVRVRVRVRVKVRVRVRVRVRVQGSGYRVWVRVRARVRVWVRIRVRVRPTAGWVAPERGACPSRSANEIRRPAASMTLTLPHARATLTGCSKCHVNKWPASHLSTVTR